MGFKLNIATMSVLAGCIGFSLAVAIRPRILFFVATIVTLVIAGTTHYFVPSFKPIWWVSYGEVFLLFIPAILSLNRRKLNPIYSELSTVVVVLIICFFSVSFISSFISKSPLIQFIAAAKSYFMFGGLWLFLAVYPLSEKIIVNWLKCLLGIGLIQIVPVLYQFIFVRSWRIAHSTCLIDKLESADSVVGTFGGSQIAGGLGAVLVFFLIVCMIVLLSFSKTKKLSRKKIALFLFVLWFPILFTEVKAAFIYLPVSIIFLYREYLYRQPVKFFKIMIYMCIIIAVMFVSLEKIHFSIRGNNWQQNFIHGFAYSFKTDDAPAVLWNNRKPGFSRISVLQFWWQQHDMNNLLETLIGHGLGSSRTQGLVEGSQVARFNGKKLDYTGLSSLLWEVGIIGTSIFLALMVAMYVLSGKLSVSKKLLDWHQFLARGLQSTIPLIALSLLYRNDIPFAASMMFVVMLIFGLINWINNQVRYPK